jgi:hypothetical protein
MPTFFLRNIDGNEITNEAHEAFEQFVLCWMFNEVLPLFCEVASERRPPAGDDGGEPLPVLSDPLPLRVLELGGGIGAVSCMIQQMIEMVDPSAPHVVFEPNALLADGPLAYNRARHGSRYHIVKGVLSPDATVPFGLGDIDPRHPRAWMWGTVLGGGAKRTTVPGVPLAFAEALLGGPPSILVADCEGGLIPVLRDYPELLDGVCALYYERDPPGDYGPAEALLAAKGFAPVLAASLHRVWINERRLRATRAAGPDAGPAPAPAPAPADGASIAHHRDAHYADLAATAAASAANLGALEALVADGAKLADRAGALGTDEASELAASTRAHFSDAYGAALALRRTLASGAAAGLEAFAGGGEPRPRVLSRNSRVLCAFREDGWDAPDYYPGCVADARDDGTYDVFFDDGDERKAVSRGDLRPVFIYGSFDWTRPFAADAAATPVDGGDEEEAAADDDDEQTETAAEAAAEGAAAPAAAATPPAPAPAPTPAPAARALGNAYDSSDDDAPSPAPARVAETPVVKTA